MELLTEIDHREVLRYMGHRGEPDAVLRGQVENGIAETMQKAVARVVYREFPLDWRGGEPWIAGNTVRLQGRDIARLLTGCERCLLMAATLGAGIDRLIASREVIDLGEALVLDACATAAVETVCDNFQKRVGRRYREKGFSLTTRFSPGYGDLPLAQQLDFQRLLDTPRRIGVSLTTSLILTPRKSVTAVIGVAGCSAVGEAGGCARCGQRDRCLYRRGEEEKDESNV